MRQGDRREITRLDPWKSTHAVVWETLYWVEWFKKRRLLHAIANIPSAEANEKVYEHATISIMSRETGHLSRRKPGRFRSADQ